MKTLAKFAYGETVMLINESYYFSSFQSRRKFTDKQPFFNTCSIFNYQKWVENWNSRLNSLF